MDYFTQRNIDFDPTKILAHRGAGSNSLLFRENTIEGVIYGFGMLDGVEIDIAISKDYSLWLTHDAKVKSINKYFINVHDSVIEKVEDENGNTYYDKLEDVLYYMSENEQTKYISLDVKHPIGLSFHDAFKSVARKISELTNKYNLQNRISVQSGSIYFLKKIREENKYIETYFMCIGNYEKGLGNVYQNRLTGISFDYKREDELIKPSVDLAHELGVKILVYSIDSDDFYEVYSLNVDIIKTDSMNFRELINIE